MGAPAHLHGYTFKDYLDLEGASNVKHEFLDGEIYAMAGGSPRHAALTLAVGGTLLAQLRGGPGRAFSSDLRIRVRQTGLATYPDVAVVCGTLEADPDSDATVTNPILIVEVLSPSTMDYDLGEKFERYRKIPSLQAVLYVSQAETRIEGRTRNADGTWTTRQATSGETVAIDAISCKLIVDDVYRDASPPG
jgi:Uma2 family endonuclease